MVSKVKAEAYTVHHDAVHGENPWEDEPSYDETRYRIVSVDTGEVLDDAQGYGYRTEKKAYAAWNYKNRDKSKDKERIEKDELIRKWMSEHPTEANTLDVYAFEIVKGSWGPDDKFDAAFIEKQLKEWGYANLPFTGREYLYTLTHKPLRKFLK